MSERTVRVVRNSGFGFLELIVVMAVVSFILVAVMDLNVHLSRSASAEAVEAGVAVFRRNIIISVIDANAWRFTTNANSAGGPYPGNMTCLRYNYNTPCQVGGAGPISNQPFAIFNGRGALLYNGTSPTEGFTPWGVRCSTFSGLKRKPPGLAPEI